MNKEEKIRHAADLLSKVTDAPIQIENIRSLKELTDRIKYHSSLLTKEELNEADTLIKNFVINKIEVKVSQWKKELERIEIS